MTKLVKCLTLYTGRKSGTCVDGHLKFNTRDKSITIKVIDNRANISEIETIAFKEGATTITYKKNRDLEIKKCTCIEDQETYDNGTLSYQENDLDYLEIHFPKIDLHLSKLIISLIKDNYDPYANHLKKL